MSLTKVCFVTVGATSSFHALLRIVLSQSFLFALKDKDYTHLRIQSGKDSDSVIDECLQALGNSRPYSNDWTEIGGLHVSIFSFKDGLSKEMRKAREGQADNTDSNRDDESGMEGALITHAGSGSILEAMRVEVPMIVVPNEDLLDNHQIELAQELSKQGYVVHGRLEALSEALEKLETLRASKRRWPPTNGDGAARADEGHLGNVMDDEMGFVD